VSLNNKNQTKLLVLYREYILSSSHRNVTISRHHIAENCSHGVKQQSLDHGTVQDFCLVLLVKFSFSPGYHHHMYITRDVIWWAGVHKLHTSIYA